MGNEELKMRFSLAAPAYDNLVARGNYEAYRRLPRRILSELKTDSAKIPDLGCGTGLGSLPFIEKGFEVTGIDFMECRDIFGCQVESGKIYYWEYLLKNERADSMSF